MADSKFPIIPQKRLDRLIRLFAEEKIKAEIFPKNTNNARLALHVGLDYPVEIDEENTDLSEGADAVLDRIGLYFHPTKHYDKEFGIAKYYFYAFNGHVWVASGDNCYGFDQRGRKELGGRIDIIWQQRLPRSVILRDILGEDVAVYSRHGTIID